MMFSTTCGRLLDHHLEDPELALQPLVSAHGLLLGRNVVSEHVEEIIAVEALVTVAVNTKYTDDRRRVKAGCHLNAYQLGLIQCSEDLRSST